MPDAFFDPPPPMPEPGERVLPFWFKPEGVLGAVVPVNFVLARTDEIAVAVWGITVFDTGFEFTLASLSRGRRFDLHRMHEFEVMRRVSTDGALPDELLRIGLTFADGSKVTNLRAGYSFGDEDAAPPTRVLMRGGGGGGDRQQTQSYWCWPLPPPGDVTFVCEWPGFGIPLTEHTIDAAPIRAAAVECRSIWA